MNAATYPDVRESVIDGIMEWTSESGAEFFLSLNRDRGEIRVYRNGDLYGEYDDTDRETLIERIEEGEREKA